VVAGGNTRFESVYKGLKQLPEDGMVAVHDGVRPLVSLETIARCFATAEKYGNAIPCIAVHETVRQIDSDNTRVIDRNTLKIIQTPQVFTSQILKKGYEQLYQPTFTDDASLLENMGIPIHLVEGNRENIKITEPIDLAIAEWMMGKYADGQM
jgi:2-C-methyl-D-erythritol 4-phosphate cytidylyltransferase